MVRHWEIHFSPRRISASICFLVCALLSAGELLGQATPCCGQAQASNPTPWSPPIPPVNQATSVTPPNSTWNPTPWNPPIPPVNGNLPGPYTHPTEQDSRRYIEN